jgi:hypothetical protein
MAWGLSVAVPVKILFDKDDSLNLREKLLFRRIFAMLAPMRKIGFKKRLVGKILLGPGGPENLGETKRALDGA